jgi:hypothetical protein
MIERQGSLEEFQSFVRLGGRIYLACNIRAFCAVIVVRCGKPKQGD